MTMSQFAAGVFLALTVSAGNAATTAPPYPQVAQIEHGDHTTAQLLERHFAAKSKHDIAGALSFFAPDMATYTDATLGWPLNSYTALKEVFEKFMPNSPPTAISYPIRILGGPGSALVEFVDTKEMFGSELRVFGVVDFKGGKIVRWVDYWDADTFDAASYQKMRTPKATFPVEFKEGVVGDNAAPAIRTVATDLQAALARGDAQAAAAFFSDEAIFEDRTLRTQVFGGAAIGRYLTRILAAAPFGTGSTLRHVVGGNLGGGFEWIAPSRLNALSGVSAIELNAAGKITRFSVVYDGRQLTVEQLHSLALLAQER